MVKMIHNCYFVHLFGLLIYDAVFSGTQWRCLGAVTEQQFSGISIMALLWGEIVWSWQRHHDKAFIDIKTKTKTEQQFFGTSTMAWLCGEVVWSWQRHHHKIFVDTKTKTSTTLGPQQQHRSEVVRSWQGHHYKTRQKQNSTSFCPQQGYGSDEVEVIGVRKWLKLLCELDKDADTKTKTKTNTSKTLGPQQRHCSEVSLPFAVCSLDTGYTKPDIQKQARKPRSYASRNSAQRLT